MTADETGFGSEDMLSAQETNLELQKRLEESRRTISSLEQQLGDISRTLAGVMEIAKTAFPEAYEEYMRKKQNTEEENT